jgi:hypothetical protein
VRKRSQKPKTTLQSGQKHILMQNINNREEGFCLKTGQSSVFSFSVFATFGLECSFMSDQNVTKGFKQNN